jgi:hypothetical protein
MGWVRTAVEAELGRVQGCGGGVCGMELKDVHLVLFFCFEVCYLHPLESLE